MKKRLMLFILFLSIATLVACGGNNGTDAENVADDELREFTLEELAQYDGIDGRDAYVAVDGFVYDMTNSSYWIEGSHQGRVQAGQDLSVEINSSPHGKSILSRVPRIGILVDEE